MDALSTSNTANLLLQSADARKQLAFDKLENSKGDAKEIQEALIMLDIADFSNEAAASVIEKFGEALDAFKDVF